jgi:ketosteroid isomerase-like protein
MAEKKALEFLGSEEELKIIETIGNLLKIGWEDEKISKIGYLTEEIIRFNKTSEAQVKEVIKKWLDFLNEDEINNLYQFLSENFLPKVRELWQEEEEIEEESVERAVIEETFEEKEKRYLEMMKNLVQPIKEKTNPVETKTEEDTEEFKTISYQPQKEEQKPLTENLPENTIVITKKKEEEQKGEDKLLDISNL